MTTAVLHPTSVAVAQSRRTALWALLLGIVSGLACVGLRLTFRLLQWLFLQSSSLLPTAASLVSPGRRLLTPVLGACCATAVLWAATRWSRAEPSLEYVEAVRYNDGRIVLLSTLWRTLSSAFSVATGAAVGREGSMIQFAAAVTSWLGAHSPLRSVPLSRQVAYGAAAAVAAAYQAPIAGVFFTLEIVLGEWAWTEIPQLVLASTAGWLVSRLVLGAGPLFAVPTVSLSSAALWTLPLALVLGACGPMYQKLLHSFRFAGRWPLALVWAGLGVGLLGLAHPAVWGNGDVALANALQGNQALTAILLLLALRLVATAFCIGAGTVGGVFTPTLFAGASIGLASAHLLHSAAPILLAIAGLSALLSAVTHAPVMAACMAVELTGQYHLLLLLLPLNIVAWLVARAISSQSLYAIATPAPMSS